MGTYKRVPNAPQLPYTPMVLPRPSWMNWHVRKFYPTVKYSGYYIDYLGCRFVGIVSLILVSVTESKVVT